MPALREVMTVRELAERGYFSLCGAMAWLLGSARYSKVRIARQGGECHVRKHRLFYAPLVVWLAVPVLEILDAGVRVLPQRDWEERERRLYRSLHSASVHIEADGLVLPCLTGETLAALLEDPELVEPVRRIVIERAVVALAEVHRLGLTHGDAMAENVMVDEEAGIARWFDFETVHDASRPIAWRRADDLRALLATCLVRTDPERLAETLQLILDAYGDERVTRVLAGSFTSIFHRRLAFHLSQAGLSLLKFREIACLLNERVGESPSHAKVGN